MIDFGLTLGGIAIGTFAPLFVALILFSRMGAGGPSRVRYAASLGLGITLFFLIDITIDSTELGVNSGFSGGGPQAALLISFVMGALLLTFLESQSFKSTLPHEGSLFLVPAFVALALGIHGAGEGSSFAFVASTTSSSSILGAFGGVYPLVSYVFHKFLEAIVVGCSYFVYQSPGSFQRNRAWEVLILGLLMGIPSVLGAFAGYSFSVHPIYFYAFAAGASIYVITKLALPSLLEQWDARKYSPSTDSVVIMTTTIVGFLLLYFAGLFHSTL